MSGRRPRLLDLFCCAGGAAEGYARAGFEVVGVDIKSQPRYPFEFIKADVLGLDPAFLASFDAVHASPPCQGYTDLRHAPGAIGAPRLIGHVRGMLVNAAYGTGEVARALRDAAVRITAIRSLKEDASHVG